MKPIDRLTILCMNPPYPANEGGKADVWRQIQALHLAGVEVQLIYWVQGQEAVDEVPSRLKEVTSSLVRFVAKRTLKKMPPWDLLITPFHATKYRLSKEDELSAVRAIADFRSQAILVQGVWVSEVGRILARRTELPYLYRSHNIEHLYMPRQAKVARSWKSRLALWASNLHLKRFESLAFSEAVRVYDISHEEMLWWKSRGIQHIEWLPPIAEVALRELPSLEKTLDVLFLGNLFAPNNVNGVLWLLEQVWPRVLANRPETRLTIVGSNPVQIIKDQIACARNVELIANVPDPIEFQARAKVLVNPVLFGSGVQLKSVDMLAVGGRGLVSTTQGVAGFPDWLKREISPVDDPEEFAQLIMSRLDTKDGILGQKYRDVFGVDAANTIRYGVMVA